MYSRNVTRKSAAVVVAVWFGFSSMTMDARTKVKPGFNLFSPQQDVELGREAAQQADKQVVLLNDPAADRYVNGLGRKLAAKSLNPNYPWTFKVVNDRAINAFALPGGFIYVNRGALEAADNEAQIAGVVGHEIGHVVARHGTSQMSKAMFPQLGLALLGGLSPGKGGWASTLARYGVPLGLNLYFMKNSREHEAQADLLGTQEMTDAGYDPHQLARFFEKLEGQSRGNVSGAAAWFSDHPSPENRVQSIDKEISTLTVTSHPVEDTPDFDRVKAHLKSLPPPPKPKPNGAGTRPGSAGPNSSGSQADMNEVAPPSGKYRTFSARENLYTMDYPAEWQVFGEDTTGVTIVPKGGVQEIDQRTDIVYGIQVSLFEAEGHHGHQDSLETMTDQFVGSLLQGNSYLREDRSRQQQRRISGRPVLFSWLEGDSPYRSVTEVVWIATQRFGGHQLLAILCIAPKPRFSDFEPAFRHAVESIRFEE